MGLTTGWEDWAACHSLARKRATWMASSADLFFAENQLVPGGPDCPEEPRRQRSITDTRGREADEFIG